MATRNGRSNGLGNGGNTVPPTNMGNHKINDMWSVRRTRHRHTNAMEYHLITAASDDIVETSAPITSPAMIEIIDQLVKARNLNADIAGVMKPYLTERREQELMNVLESTSDDS